MTAPLRRKPADARVLNLDESGGQSWMLVYSYRGVRTAIDRERLDELLRLEEEALVRLTAGGEPEPAKGEPTIRSRQIPTDAISHASLSNRITKIHNYSKQARALRPAHAGLLGEVLAAFDWEIPEHPNLKLEQLLKEMVAWGGLSDELRKAMTDFLRRYAKARAAG